MPDWARTEEIVNRFNMETARMGPQYACVCAVHDALSEQTATQGVGLLDPHALLQMFASMTDTVAQVNQWSAQDVRSFLEGVGDAVLEAWTQQSDTDTTLPPL